MTTPQNPFDSILAEARQALAATTTAADVAAVRQTYLGRKGRLTLALRAVGDAPAKERARLGALGNTAKTALEQELIQAQPSVSQTRPSIDPTLPGKLPSVGHPHPISLALDELIGVFQMMGFDVVEGPEVETDYYNFEALNMDADHPARDMQDTFYLAGSEKADGIFSLLPRTHTSGVQVRYMETHQPPVRIVVPGRVFRNENEDATHSAMFNQLEGLMIDEVTSFADLKGILVRAAQALLGDDIKLRFRPSFFPYTEPSAEIDMSSPRVRDGAWIELGGSGMVHPEVLRRVGYDPERYQGFAFGIGPDRLAMLKYGIQDLRHFYRPDVRLLEQF